MSLSWLALPAIALLIAAPVVVPIGVLLLGRQRSISRRATQVQQEWSRAPGQVLSSDVQGSWRSARAASEHQITAPRYVYEPRVQYAFTLAGRTFQSNQLSLSDVWTAAPGPAEETVRRYPVGATVTVHYDPVDPTRSVLELGDSSGGRSFTTRAAVLSLAAVAVFALVLLGFVVLNLGIGAG
jgi:hypothetical protein